MLSQVYTAAQYYQTNKDEEIKERIETHLVMVKRIAFHMKAIRLTITRCVSIRSLISSSLLVW